MFCLGWPGTSSLPILASQVARIIGISHWHLDTFNILKQFSLTAHNSVGKKSGPVWLMFSALAVTRLSVGSRPVVLGAIQFQMDC
jgi:hypothetical protein